MVYSLAALYAVFIALRRPAVASALPHFATTIDEVTASTVALGWAESIARLLGPALAGVILVVGSPGAVMMTVAALAMLGAVATVGSVPKNALLDSADDPDRASIGSEMLAGWRRIARSDLRAVTAILFVLTLVAGALDVGAAAIATSLLGVDEVTVALLLAAFGGGYMIGATFGVTLIGMRHLALASTTGVAAASIAFMSLAVVPSIAAAVAVLVAVGLFSSLASLSARMLLVAIAPFEMVARILALVESGFLISLAVGGLAFSGIAVAMSVKWAVVVLGVFGALAPLAVLRPLRRIDASRPRVDRDLVNLLRKTVLFAPVPVLILEQLSARLRHETISAGEFIMRAGEAGTEMAIVGSGNVRIRRGSVDILVGPGEYIGEVAALYGTVRNADVTAGPDGAELYWLETAAPVNSLGWTSRSVARILAETKRRGVGPNAEPQIPQC